MRRRSLAGHLIAALGGACAGAVAVLLLGGSIPAADETPSPPLPSIRATESAEGPPSEEQAILAWAPSPGLGRDAERAVARLEGIAVATLVETGLDWIASVETEGGASLLRSPRDLAYPVDVAAVDPATYSLFVPPSERSSILSLRGTTILLARTTARRWGAAAGSIITRPDGRSWQVSGIVSDQATSGYEMILAGQAPARWGSPRRFLLALDAGAGRSRVAAVTRRSMEAGRPLRVRVRGETPFLRYGDAVAPQMYLKERFGEFAARSAPDGTIEIDPHWKNHNLKTENIPVLGRVTCHRALLPQLKAATKELRAEGLSHLVTDHAGCFSPRHLNRDPDSPLSHHAWGIAFDINAGTNPYGSRPRLEQKVVDVFERWGLTWGGRWLVPDGMHFEWLDFP